MAPSSRDSAGTPGDDLAGQIASPSRSRAASTGLPFSIGTTLITPRLAAYQADRAGHVGLEGSWS